MSRLDRRGQAGPRQHVLGPVFAPAPGDRAIALRAGLRQAGQTGRFEVLSIDRVQPPPEVAEWLDVSAKTKPSPPENIFYADDDPVHRVTTYIPRDIAKGTGRLRHRRPCRDPPRVPAVLR